MNWTSSGSGHPTASAVAIETALIASLAKRSYSGAAWTLVGYAISQALRLTSNLVLTHLLAPEHFGLMALVSILLVALNMFSDLGIGPNVIQSERGNDPRFLDSAWTVQIIRGLCMWACCLLAAWPFARFYSEPQLIWLVPASGLGAVIAGFNSTKIFTANRDLNVRSLTIIEIGSQVAAIAGMIVLAKVEPSVWVLVFGALYGALVKMIASHFFLPGRVNRWLWDRYSVRELFKFGRWIFVSTVLSFVVNSAGSLILAKVVSIAEVGVFAIASTLAKAVEQAYEQIGQKVLFPLYAKLREQPLPELRRDVANIRVAVMATFLPLLWLLTVFGQQIIDKLLDSRYRQAGWMLQVFAAGLIPVIVTGVGPFYLALGNSFLLMNMSALRLLTYIVAVWIGWDIAGSIGMICGMAMHTVVVYLAELYIQKSYSIWVPKLDLAAFALSALVIGAGLTFT